MTPLQVQRANAFLRTYNMAGAFLAHSRDDESVDDEFRLMTMERQELAVTIQIHRGGPQPRYIVNEATGAGATYGHVDRGQTSNMSRALEIAAKAVRARARRKENPLHVREDAAPPEKRNDPTPKALPPRFRWVLLEGAGAANLVDSETGREARVPLYATGGIRDVLADLFGE